MPDTIRPNSLDAFWMPFTPNRAFKADPRMVVRAEGMHYSPAAAKPCSTPRRAFGASPAGTRGRSIVEAIQRTAAELDYAVSFNLGHPLAFEFANRLAAILPEGIDRIAFTNSGSESADTALKIALAYQKARGKPGKFRLIGRERGYHGTNFGGISVGGITRNRMTFGPMVGGVDHLPHTLDIARNAFSRGLPAHGVELADALERLVQLHDACTIAAVIVEPVAGSTGVIIPPKGYLERLRELCTKHDILLIFDEVITGFGRLGAPFASHYFDVKPDIITMAKAITNAAVPMGAVAASREIYDTVLANADTPIELFHGYTIERPPPRLRRRHRHARHHARKSACSSAPRSLRPIGKTRCTACAMRRHVIDIRNLGLIGGIELEPRPGAASKRALEAFNICFDKGLLIRVTGDIIAFSPPLIVEKAQIDLIVDTLRAVLSKID